MAPTSKEAQRAELHKTIWQVANDLRGSVDGWERADGDDSEILAQIAHTVDDSPTLRNKKDLIEGFVGSLSVDGEIDHK